MCVCVCVEGVTRNGSNSLSFGAEKLSGGLLEELVQQRSSHNADHNHARDSPRWKGSDAIEGLPLVGPARVAVAERSLVNIAEFLLGNRHVVDGESGPFGGAVDHSSDVPDEDRHVDQVECR